MLFLQTSVSSKTQGRFCVMPYPHRLPLPISFIFSFSPYPYPFPFPLLPLPFPPRSSGEAPREERHGDGGGQARRERGAELAQRWGGGGTARGRSGRGGGWRGTAAATAGRHASCSEARQAATRGRWRGGAAVGQWWKRRRAPRRFFLFLLFLFLSFGHNFFLQTFPPNFL